MTFPLDLTGRSVALAGGMIATFAALTAQAVANDNAVGTGSFLLGGAGLIAAISAFTKDFWTDRQKQREHETALLRIKLRSCRTCNALHELSSWARNARLVVPALPPVPEIRLDGEDGPGPVNGSLKSSDAEKSHA
jgi:hypothetical protein